MALDPTTRVPSKEESELEMVTSCIDALEEAADADHHRALALREVGVFALTGQLSRMVARRDKVEAAYQSMGGSLAAGLGHVRLLLDAASRETVEEAPHK